MNEGMENEKLMTWDYKHQYRSEDSDDEETIFGRTKRQFYRSLK